MYIKFSYLLQSFNVNFLNILTHMRKKNEKACNELLITFDT